MSSACGVGTREGRPFSEGDNSEAERVILVNQSFERFFHGESSETPHSSRGLDEEGLWMTIVGAVPDLRMNADEPQLDEGMYSLDPERDSRFCPCNCVAALLQVEDGRLDTTLARRATDSCSLLHGSPNRILTGLKFGTQ